MVIVGDEPFILQSEIAKSCVTGPSTNGRSSAFGALCLGSNPSGPARKAAVGRSSFVVGEGPRTDDLRRFSTLTSESEHHGNSCDGDGKEGSHGRGREIGAQAPACPCRRQVQDLLRYGE